MIPLKNLAASGPEREINDLEGRGEMPEWGRPLSTGVVSEVAS